MVSFSPNIQDKVIVKLIDQKIYNLCSLFAMCHITNNLPISRDGGGGKSSTLCFSECECLRPVKRIHAISLHKLASMKKYSDEFY